MTNRRTSQQTIACLTASCATSTSNRAPCRQFVPRLLSRRRTQRVFASITPMLASMPGAPCFVCHLNVAPAAVRQQQCVGCHEVMMPVTHTARWKDDVHGKYAALDRKDCAVCHLTDFCSRCHNETPRSHLPLPQFKAGGHAKLAMMNLRSCFTCHTFENTCAECHGRGLK